MSKLANIIIGLTLFSMFMYGTAQYINGFRDDYNVTISEGWEEVYLHEQNLSLYKANITNVLEDKNTNWVVSGLRMGYSVLRTMLEIPDYLQSILSNMVQDTNIPGWVVIYGFDLIGIIIILILVAALVRWYI